MAIVAPYELENYLAFTPEMGGGPGFVLSNLIDAAQGYIERQLGFQISARFGGAGQDPIPEPLKQAVLMLAAFWFGNREAAGEGLREVPFGVTDIIDSYRDRSF